MGSQLIKYMLLSYGRIRARGIRFLSQIFQLLTTNPSNSGYICHRWRLQSSVGHRTFPRPKARLPVPLLRPRNVFCPRANTFLLAALSSLCSSPVTHLPCSALQVRPFLLKEFRYLSWIDLWSLSFSHTVFLHLKNTWMCPAWPLDLKCRNVHSPINTQFTI